MARSQPEGLKVGRTELAHIFGVRAARITKYIAEGLPTESHGRGRPARFDLAACVRWLLERRAPRPGEDERARYFRLQGDKIEQEIRHRAGELVEARDVDRRWAGMVTAARERFLALPPVLLQRGLIASSAEDTVIGLVDEALTELATRGGDAQRA